MKYLNCIKLWGKKYEWLNKRCENLKKEKWINPLVQVIPALMGVGEGGLWLNLSEKIM